MVWGEEEWTWGKKGGEGRFWWGSRTYLLVATLYDQRAVVVVFLSRASSRRRACRGFPHYLFFQEHAIPYYTAGGR